MSWAEDNGIDAYDFEDIEEMRERDQIERENLWKTGWHETKDGTKIRLKDMETSHLKNTIRYFKNHDTKPLEKQLSKRK